MEFYYDEKYGWSCRYKPGHPTLAERYPRATFFAFVVLPTLIALAACALYLSVTLPTK